MSPRVTLKQISYFLAAAEEENFRRAAKRMHVSQPPLSKQIRQLEEALGVDLFVRRAGRVQLTPAGAQLKESGANVLMQVRRAVDDTRRAAVGFAGRLCVGFTDDFVFSSVAKVIGEYHKRYPDVIVETHIDLTAELAEEIMHRESDIAFVCPPLPTFANDIRLQPLKPTHILALVPVSHPLASRQHIQLGELKRDKFIVEPRLRATGFFARLGMLFDEAGFAPTVIHECESSAMTVKLVAAGVGVALISEHTIMGTDERVVALPLSGAKNTVKRAAIWHRDNQSPRLERFLEVATDVTE